MAFFLCQLRGPRPTFPGDMSAEEGALMGEHAAYWGGLACEGTAVAFGPVFDPAGPWGLALVEIADEAGARSLTEADPVIRAGRGFRYDIHPMPQVVLRATPASAAS